MSKKLTRKEWRHRRRRKAVIIFSAICILTVTLIGLVGLIIERDILEFGFNASTYTISKNTTLKGDYPQALNLNVKLLTPNPYSRPQTKLEKIKGVVIHYTANPGTDAIANRNYFDNLKVSGTTKVSSHFVIGLEGDIVQCIPTSEIAYASNKRNDDTISIEVCHPDESGKFTKKSYNTLVRLTAWLVCEYNLDSDYILRHFDVTGKNCPKYFVENEDEWDDFKKDVYSYIDENKG